MESWNQSSGDEYLNGTQFDDHNATLINWNADIGVLPKITFSVNLIGFLGNFITILYIICSKHLHTPTFFAICSLAITDFIVCMISLLDQFVDDTSFRFVLYKILFIAMFKSSFDVVFLFFLRYALIVHPLKCKQYLTNSFVISASLTFWEYSVIVFSLIFLIQYLLYVSNMSIFKRSLIFTAIIILIITVLPVTIISILHCLKQRTLRSSTVNTAITRKMSFVIIIIAALNVIFGILLLLDESNAVDIIGLMHSFNPFILFLFHVSYKKCVSYVPSCCDNG